MVHRLDPLLRPRSVAVVGASARPGSPGNEALVNLRKAGFGGEVLAVNPGRSEVEGRPCYPALGSLPIRPDLALFAVADERLEPLFDEALALGVPAAAVFSGLAVPGESQPGLRERIRDRALAAGMLLHGGNCMGFYNIRDRVWVSGFDTREHRGPGHVALLSQSGAGMSGILDCDDRLQFCFAASTGQELCLGVEDYLDYVLELDDVRVVGLFLETSRQPLKLVAALEKARAKRIPVVALKVGRTELAAELAVSHSGALAGADGSFSALFDRYGVQRVDDMAELAAALLMFSQPGSIAAGSLVTLHDSGGERQLTCDLAAQTGTTLTTLSRATRRELESLLDPGLPAVNPLDAWGRGGAEAPEAMGRCFSTLLGDPGAALGAVVHDRAPGGDIYPGYLEYLRAAREAHAKPVFLVANHRGSGDDPVARTAAREGIPVLDGLREFLVGARCLMAWRDHLLRDTKKPPDTSAAREARAASWRIRLPRQGSLPEVEAGRLLRDFGVHVLPLRAIASEEELTDASFALEFPLVLKTGAAGIAHKSDRGGVALNLETREQLLSAYRDMAGRLGPRALVGPMVTGPGVEMLLGTVRDPQFGPVVVIGFGGVQAEVLADTATLLPPFSAGQARAALARLRLRPLLDDHRGRAPVAVDEFCEMAARFSLLAVDLSDRVAEVDLNPVILQPDRCVAVDALVVCRDEGTDQPGAEVVPSPCEEADHG